MTGSPGIGGRQPSRPVRVALTFLIAAAGGALATLAGMPAGWVAGALLSTAIASLAGLETEIPRRIRPFVYLVLGIYAGTGVSPETLEQMRTWPFSFLVLGVSLVAMISGSYLFLQKSCGWDRTSALLSSLPGALSFVMAAAEGIKADMRRVAVAQSIRLVVLVQAVPLGIYLIGAPENLPHHAMLPPMGPLDILVLLVAGGAAGLVLERLGLIGGMMLGGLLASGALFLSGTIEATVPRGLMLPFIVTLGAISGSRFRPGDHVLLKAMGLQAFAGFAIAMAVSLLAAIVVSQILGVHLMQAILAFAPGALDALVIVSISLDIDPAYVAAHHVVRFLALALTIPFVARWLIRGRTAREAEERKD